MSNYNTNTILKVLGYIIMAFLMLGIVSILILGFCYNLPICSKEYSDNTKCITISDKDFIKKTMIITGSVLLFFLVIFITVFLVYSHYNKNVNEHDSDDELLINGRPYQRNFYF